MTHEESLRKSGELFRAIFEASSGGLLIVNQTGEIIQCNPQFAEMFQISDEHMQSQEGQKILESILNQIQNPDDFLSATLELRKSLIESYDVLIFKDGRVFERFGSPLVIEEGLNGRVYSFRDVTERVHAEEALRESENRYRLLADNVTDVLWILDINLQFTFISPSVKQMFGYTVEEAMSKSLNDIMVRDSFEIFMAEFAEALTADISDGNDFSRQSTAVVEMLHQDGSIMLVELSRSFVRNNDGILIGILGVARDITSRKRAEETQERERKAYHIIAEAAVRATTVSDLCHRVMDEVAEVLEFDVGAVKLYDEQEHLLDLVAVVGMSETEVKKKTAAQVLEDPEMVVPLVIHTRNDIFSVDVTTQDSLNDPNLSLDEIETRLVISWPIQGTGQFLLGVMLLMAYTPKEVSEKDLAFIQTVAGMFATVLERRRAEESLRESEERFVLFADHIPGPLYIKNHESRILFVNKFMRFTVGDDWTGKNNFDLFPNEMAEQLTIEERRVITEGQIEATEIRQDENGKLQVFQSLRFPIYRGAKPPLIGGFSIDVTRQKTAEEQLERAVARAELLNDLMVHDLNNMHQGIMSYLELILMASELPSSLKEYVENALTQTERGVALVGNVRKFSTVDRNHFELSPVDPYLPLMTSIDMIESEFPKKTISLNTNISEESYSVFANDFLVDVFYNILHNSMKVDMNNDVILDVYASPSKEAGFMRFAFSDRGPGINDETKETVLSRLEDRRKHGWGLGLTLVKRIIDGYRGRIWIEDRVEGDYKQGASIVILLADADSIREEQGI